MPLVTSYSSVTPAPSLGRCTPPPPPSSSLRSPSFSSACSCWSRSIAASWGCAKMCGTTSSPTRGTASRCACRPSSTLYRTTSRLWRCPTWTRLRTRYKMVHLEIETSFAPGLGLGASSTVSTWLSYFPMEVPFAKFKLPGPFKDTWY